MMATRKSRKSTGSTKAASGKKRSRKAPTRKKSTARKKKAPARKVRARKSNGAATSAADLRKRAAQAETDVQVETPPAEGVNALAMSLGGLQLQNLDLNNIDLEQLGETVQGVIDFVEENPLTSAAVALGAGVVLTSMYWDKVTGKHSGPGTG